MSAAPQRPHRQLLGSAEIHRMLRDYVRRRVPESDVDDVVQTVLVEALASDRAPEEKGEFRKWLTGVARHKIADHHRRSGRERPAELPDIETAPAPIEEHELARWAEDQAKASKDGDATLRWMAREGEGDKLEHIAAEEMLPAATVRQRVSRMRRWMKERWLAELAAAAAVLALLVYLVYRSVIVRPPDEMVEKDVIPPVPSTTQAPHPNIVAPSPLERAAELRRQALSECDDEPRDCLDKLDEAKRLDPAGDMRPEVQDARNDAEERLSPEPIREKKGDEPEPKPAPTPTSTPVAPPTTARPPTTTAPAVPKSPTTTLKPSPKSGFDGPASLPSKPEPQFVRPQESQPSSPVLDQQQQSVLKQPPIQSAPSPSPSPVKSKKGK